jgi:hypothetical protein
MSFWQKSTGEIVTPQDSFESKGGSMEPIPEKTVLTVIVSEIKWTEWEGEHYINARYDVVDGNYKGRVQFDKLRVYGTDKQKDRALEKLAVLDGLSGGQLQRLPGEPTDMDLQAVTNRPLEIRVMVWEVVDKVTGEKKTGNWVQAIGKLGALSGSSKPAPQQQAAQQAPQQQAYVLQQAQDRMPHVNNNQFDDDIPF